jgi:hypothetical protein
MIWPMQARDDVPTAQPGVEPEDVTILKRTDINKTCRGKRS